MAPDPRLSLRRVTVMGGPRDGEVLHLRMHEWERDIRFAVAIDPVRAIEHRESDSAPQDTIGVVRLPIRMGRSGWIADWHARTREV